MSNSLSAFLTVFGRIQSQHQEQEVGITRINLMVLMLVMAVKASCPAIHACILCVRDDSVRDDIGHDSKNRTYCWHSRP